MPHPTFARAFGLLTALLAVSALALAAPVSSTRAGLAQNGGDAETAPFDPAAFAVALEPVVGGFERPLHVADPGDGSGRLFVVEQDGLIKVVRDGEVLPEPFLDLTGVVDRSGNERGLLSIGFHPNYARNGTFFVGFTEVDANVVARFHVSADDPDQADPGSRTDVFRVQDPYSNHNGGLVLFGPDGYLYTSFGDGGSGGDPQGNGQNPDAVLGKLLRVDVDGAEAAANDPPYAIPDDNPFAAGGGAPEVWAIGLRNPWRFSFDRETGDLWIADVGQGAYEEVNFQPADSRGGENYGWNLTEGAHCYPEGSDCSTEGLTLPVAEYGRDLGLSVTGGYVYRGDAYPTLRGVYLFADYGSGLLWGLGRSADGDWLLSDPIKTGLTVSSFGEDAAGELYITAFDGTLYRVVAPEE